MVIRFCRLEKLYMSRSLNPGSGNGGRNPGSTGLIGCRHFLLKCLVHGLRTALHKIVIMDTQCVQAILQPANLLANLVVDQ